MTPEPLDGLSGEDRLDAEEANAYRQETIPRPAPANQGSTVNENRPTKAFRR